MALSRLLAVVLVLPMTFLGANALAPASALADGSPLPSTSPLPAGPAAPAAASADPQLTRLANGHSAKMNWVPPGKTEKYGHAEVLVHAPLAAVRAIVTDHAHYKEFAPDKFQNVKVVAKEGNDTHVYFQIPVLKGLITMWYVTKFAPPKVVTPGTEIVEGKFVKGNVKDMNIVFTMRKVDRAFTILSCDLLVEPTFEAPSDLIDEELRDAAGNAVDGIHDKAQGSKDAVPFVKSGT